MKSLKGKHTLYGLLFLFIILSGCVNKNVDKEVIKFAFLTDIHLNEADNGSMEGFNKAILSAVDHGAEFIITGGDNTEVDKHKKDTVAAQKLFGIYKEIIDSSPVKINPSMGNHDRFFGILSAEKPYGEALFEETIGPAYYSFENSGWKFMILNTVQTRDKQYFVDSIQIEWIKNELIDAGKEMPLIVSVHVPMMSVYSASLHGRIGPDMFENYSEVRSLFKEYNLKLVLQGHLHIHEEIMTDKVQYITGGSVCASWWKGPYLGTEEGYLLVSLTADNCSWEYIDYGWEARD